MLCGCTATPSPENTVKPQAAADAVSQPDHLDSSRVKATISIDDSATETELIEIPSRTSIVFEHDECTEWTHDPLDAIGTIVNDVPLTFPFRKTVPPLAFRDQLLLTAAAVSQRYPRSAVRYHFTEYVGTLVHRDSMSPASSLLIDIQQLTDPEQARAKEFWKRALAVYFSPRRQEPRKVFAFGPFYDSRGRIGERGDSTPMPEATIGQVIAATQKLDLPSQRYSSVRPYHRFGQLGDVVRNDTRDPIHIRLLMNDDEPKDNSEYGWCLIYYKRDKLP